MAVKNEPLLVLLFMHVLLISAQNQDIVYLQALKDSLQNTPPNWVGSDPCGEKWDGITCTDSRVTSITLPSIDLSGELSGDIAYLSELHTLDLSSNKGLTGSLTPDIGNLKKLSNLNLVGCSFNGPLPDTLGSLSQLQYLSLNSNSFTGRIPASLGKLSKLFLLDLADNELTGSIPVSEGATPGLDLLVNTKHFHFGNNKLSGEIPAKLFSSKMTLIHVLFEDNQFTGFIPSTLGLVQTLGVLRLDRNLLSGNVPSNINNLTRISRLFLSNNKLSGPFPNLIGMSRLNYLDISNNSFKASVIPPWVTSLKSLTTLMMQDTELHGEVPVGLFSIPQIETVVLRNNQLNGTLDFGNAYSTHLKLIDISNNLISGLTPQSSSYTDKLILVKNPICTESETKASYCDPSTEFNSSYLTPPNNCNASPTCGLGQVSSPSCNCSYPYTGNLTFRAPSFSDLGNLTILSLQNSMMVSFKSNQLPVDSVSLSRPIKNADDYLVVNLEIFPFGSERFNRSGILRIGFFLSSQTYRPPDTFGPYVFIGNNYDYFLGKTSYFLSLIDGSFNPFTYTWLVLGQAMFLSYCRLCIVRGLPTVASERFSIGKIDQKSGRRTTIRRATFSSKEIETVFRFRGCSYSDLRTLKPEYRDLVRGIDWAVCNWKQTNKGVVVRSKKKKGKEYQKQGKEERR